MLRFFQEDARNSANTGRILSAKLLIFSTRCLATRPLIFIDTNIFLDFYSATGEVQISSCLGDLSKSRIR
jgi:hypothetical protein